MKISNSKLDLYSQCPRKYKFRYVENLKGDYTSSALLFGTALDQSLNYILQSLKDKKEWNKEIAIQEFDKVLQSWDGLNRLDFFKGDVPDALKDSIDEDDLDFQEQVWEELYKRGLNCLDIYINEVLPQFKDVLEVQNKVEIKNEEDDIFVGVIDFIAKLHDDRVVLFDNKTASAKYPKNKVVKSQQLSLYLENFPEIKYAGYIVLIKNPVKEKGLTHQIMIDEIPEETTDNSYKLLEETLKNIKEEKFPCNYKSCKAYNKDCEYSLACQYGNYEGLVPSYLPKIVEEEFNKLDNLLDKKQRK